MGGAVNEPMIQVTIGGAATQDAVETAVATALHLRELEARYKIAAHRDAKNENERDAALSVAGLLATFAQACDELGAAAAATAAAHTDDVAADVSLDEAAAVEAVEQLLSDDVAGDDDAPGDTEAGDAT